MVAAVESLVYVKDRGVPWHGLGTPADGLMTAAEVLEKAGLNWKVEQRPIKVDGKVVPSHVANVRDSDNRVLGIVGRKYHVVQNADQLSVLDNVVDSGEAKYDTAGSLWDGRRVLVSMEIPNHIAIKGDDSPYQTYIVAMNGHDGGMSFQIIRTEIRVVCHNTMQAARSSALSRWAIRHTSGATRHVGDVREALGVTFQELETFNEMGNRLAAIAISERKAKDVLLQLFPLPKTAVGDKEAMAESEFAAALANWKSSETIDDKLRGTGWGLYNAVVEFADFGLEYRGDNASMNRANNLITGRGRPNGIKEHALKLLLG